MKSNMQYCLLTCFLVINVSIGKGIETYLHPSEMARQLSINTYTIYTNNSIQIIWFMAAKHTKSMYIY